MRFKELFIFCFESWLFGALTQEIHTQWQWLTLVATIITSVGMQMHSKLWFCWCLTCYVCCWTFYLDTILSICSVHFEFYLVKNIIKHLRSLCKKFCHLRKRYRSVHCSILVITVLIVQHTWQLMSHHKEGTQLRTKPVNWCYWTSASDKVYLQTNKSLRWPWSQDDDSTSINNRRYWALRRKSTTEILTWTVEHCHCINRVSMVSKKRPAAIPFHGIFLLSVSTKAIFRSTQEPFVLFHVEAFQATNIWTVTIQQTLPT